MKYLVALIFWSGAVGLGQISVDKGKSSIKITGTSSLHDWEMTVNDYDISGEITASQVENLNVVVTAKSMKSGKSIMDEKAHDAVKADDFPTITFQAKKLDIKGNKIVGQGLLEIGGVKNTVPFSADIIKNTGTSMRITGKLSLKMSAFSIEPPTAMFGTLKTGDEVVIHYDIFLTN